MVDGPDAPGPARLQRLERDFVEHVTGSGPVSGKTTQSWGAERSISATFLRDALRHRSSDVGRHGMRLSSARIVGRLDLRQLTIGIPIEFHDCSFEEGIDVRDANLRSLSLDGSALSNHDQPALHAESLIATGHVSLAEANIRAKSVKGAVSLVGGNIGGRLDCSGTTIVNPSSSALDAEGLTVTQDVFLRGRSAPGGKASHNIDREIPFTAFGTGGRGTVRLFGAQIGGQLDCSGANIRNASGPALHADGLHVDRGLFLVEKFTAIGMSKLGAVRLLGGHVALQFDCTNATIGNDSGPAIAADHLLVTGSVFMRGSYTGHGESGTVRLIGGHIAGQFNCHGTTISNDAGPALRCDHLTVEQRMLLENGEFTSEGELGTVHLPDVHVGGDLKCTGAKIKNRCGSALSAEGLNVDHDLILDGEFAALAAGPGAVCLNLTRARVSGAIVWNPEAVTHGQNHSRRAVLDGLTYSGIPICRRASRKQTNNPLRDDWLDLLRTGTPEYSAQPYQQLAAAYRAAGHDHAARQVLRDQHHDRLHRHLYAGRYERAWGQIAHITLGYGYQPWRALIFLFATVVTAVTLSMTLGGLDGLAAGEATPAVGYSTAVSGRASPCTVADQVGIGLDISLPLIKTGSQDRCHIVTSTPAGTALLVGGWALQLASWAFATLFVAGFTSAVRKP